MLKIFFVLCLLLSAAENPEKEKLPDRFKAKVISVKDGDTIEILFNGNPLKIRLAHIDCPEVRRSQPFGKAAKQFTSAMCFGQIVTIENENKFDRYKRLIAVVINNKGQNINKELLKSGLAWHFKKYSRSLQYAELELQARRKHIGLWADASPIPPWNWRKH